jgi:hypothetical protein
MKKNISILIIIIIMLVVAGCNDPLKPPYQLGNDPINAHQFGFTVQDGEWLYYMDREKQISRTNGAVTETYENTYGRGLNTHGDYIYFLGYGEKIGLYKVHKKKLNQIEPLIQDTYVSKLIIVNGHLYYSRFGNSKSGLYRSNLDGQKEKQLLKATINGFQFYDGWFYVAVIDGGSVLKISPNGKEAGKLQTEDGLPISTTSFIIYDDWIYFENRSDEIDERYRSEVPQRYNNIYRMKLDGSNLEYLIKGYTLALVGEGPHIYYMFQENQDDKRQLIRMNVDTGEKNVLYQGERYLHWGNKIGNDLFFIDWGNDPAETTTIYQTKLKGGKLEVFIE